MTFWGFVASVISALLGAGAANLGFEWWREHRSRQDRAAWVALRAVVALDDFAVECINAANAPMEPERMSELPRVPALPPLPEDTEGWRSIERALAERLLRLPTKRAWAEMAIEEIFSDRAWGLAAHTYARETAQVGLEAALVSRDLTRTYRLMPSEHDIVESLEGRVAEAVRAIEEYEKRPSFMDVK